MVLSQRREPQYRPQNTIVLLMGTPKNLPLNASEDSHSQAQTRKLQLHVRLQHRRKSHSASRGHLPSFHKCLYTQCTPSSLTPQWHQPPGREKVCLRDLDARQPSGHGLRVLLFPAGTASPPRRSARPPSGGQSSHECLQSPSSKRCGELYSPP